MRSSKATVLPHYKIVMDSELFETAKDYLGPIYDVLYGELADLDRSVAEILMPLVSLPSIARLFNLQDGGDISTTTGLTAPVRYKATHGRTFEVDPALNYLLEQTDIGSKAPGSSFQLPFNSIYLHFPKTTLRVPESDTQEDPAFLSGIYINEVFSEGFERDSRHQLNETGSFRGFEFIFMSEGTNANPLDSTYIHSRFIIPDAWADDPIEDIVIRQMDVYEEMGKRGDDRSFVSFKRSIVELVEHTMKCLLFINSQEAILTNNNEHTEVTQRLDRVQKAKKRKIEKQLNRVYDRIQVTHHITEDDRAVDHESQGGLKRSHWRRGHFRQQAHGKGRVDRKTLWIRPTLIHGDKDIVTKNYSVK